MIEQTIEPKQSVGQVLKYMDVNMTDHFEYDTPDTLHEWEWIEGRARWAHRGNGVEGGVWEYMVTVSTFENDPGCVPDTLKPFFEQAVKEDCFWIMFNQG